MPRGATRETRDWRLAYWLIGSVIALGFLALVTSPVAALLGDSGFAIPSTLHGVTAILYVILGTILAYLGYRMYTGTLQSYQDARVLSVFSASLALLTVLFGNWIYIAYRWPTGSPRTYFLETQPAIHEIFFEFKEFMALFTVPVAVAAACILLREGEGLRQRPIERQIAGILLIIAWAFLMLVFGLGAAITRLRSV